MPDTSDAEITEIEPNVMQAITSGTLQDDSTEADRSQATSIDVNTIYADAFDGDGYSSETSSEDEPLDGEASDTASQGTKVRICTIVY